MFVKHYAPNHMLDPKDKLMFYNKKKEFEKKNKKTKSNYSANKARSILKLYTNEYIMSLYSKIPILRPPLELSKSGLKDHFWTVPKVVSNQRYPGCRK